MFRFILLGLILYCTESHASIALKRQSMIHHEPPFENFKSNDRIDEHYITQPVDHFNHQDNRTFSMRYLTNDQHFKSGGPIFIVIGGEWEISAGHILPGQHIYDIARDFNGLLIYTEHRFYGKTWPFRNVSTENLKYLSVDQSLADLANFVHTITSDEKLNATGGVVVVGGSYAASMAVWFRQKYPHLVKGAWASSGPLNAKLNYVEYMETVGRSMLKIGGQQCHSKLVKAFKEFDAVFANKDIETLEDLFGLCKGFNIDNNLDVWNFYSSVRNIFAGVVQRHVPGHIEKYCQRLEDKPPNSDEIPELFALAKIFRQEYSSIGCYRFDYEKDIKQLQAVDTDLARDFRPWFYQTCSEFGWYQTTDSTNQPFGTKSPIAFYLQYCKDVFGDVFADLESEKNMHLTNVKYGGFIPGVTNVYFTQGSLDPWHPMGVLGDYSAHSPGVVIEDISHCRDLSSINYNKDSKQLIGSKVTIKSLVNKWLKY